MSAQQQSAGELVRVGMYTAAGTIIVYAAVALVLQYAGHKQREQQRELGTGCTCKGGR